MDHVWQCPTCAYQLRVYQARCPRCGTVLTEMLAHACQSCRLNDSCGALDVRPSPKRALLWGKKP